MTTWYDADGEIVATTDFTHGCPRCRRNVQVWDGVEEPHVCGCTCAPNEFGIAVCDLPAHCEHASQTGDGDVWVCDVCGHRTPMTATSGHASASASAPGAPVGGASAPPGASNTGDDT